MDLIILPGNSPENLGWAKQVKSLVDSSMESMIQSYDHWKSKEKFINLLREEKKLIKSTKNLSEYMILAKSIGVILTLKSIYEQQIQPKKCIFVGVAANWAQSNNYPIDKWLRRYSIPTLFIQNENDPAISFKNLDNLLKNNIAGECQSIKLSGDTHNYRPATIANLTKTFLLD